MNRLSNKYLQYNDTSYNYAVNYQQMYNAPITLNYGEKHNRSKYIISAGTMDNIELWQDGIFIYVLSQNNGLSYISLQVINTETKEIECDIYLDSNDCENEGNLSYGILDMESEEQLKILFMYL